MELELNSLDWNVNELEHKLELEDMKRTIAIMGVVDTFRQGVSHKTLRQFKKYFLGKYIQKISCGKKSISNEIS